MKLICETYNYDMFRRLQGQRNVNQRHVDEIVKSIEEYGWISDPIRVTENMEVFDGQHRLEALKQLNMPVEYIIIDGLTTNKAVQIINNSQRRWAIRDYTSSYVEMGEQSYKLVLNLCERYGVSESTVTKAFNKDTSGSNYTSKNFKNGLFSITPEEYANADRKLAKYYKMAKAYDGHKVIGKSLERACFFLIDRGYDIDKIIESEKKKGDNGVRFDTAFSTLEYIEQTYNYKRLRDSRIYPTEEYKKSGHGRS